MKLPRLAIDNFQFMIIAVLLLLIMGVTSFLTMPRTEDPAVTAPGASIVVIFPGASPSDLEELVATPVEEAINELTDIKKFQSSLRNNLAYFSVEFEPDQDADEKYNEVVQKINSIKSSLPDEITDIEIKQFTITDVSILQMALMSADAEYRDMKTVAESMKKDLEKVQGVMSVKIHALPEAEIRVEPDFGKMAKLNISLEQVTVAIQSSNTNIPGGELEMGSRVFNIKTSGSYSSIEDIKNTVVSFTNGKLILLRDIAEVGFRYEDQAYFARFNGQRSVFITVTQKENTNIFSISEKLKEIVDKYSHELPQNMKLEAVFDQSESVNSRINGFLSNLFQGVVLVGAVIFFAIGTRASIIVILAIPMSIFIGLGFVDLSGFGLQQISIAGLVVALGLLVDNAIVITENITRFIEMGHSKRQAAILGTQQIGWPMVSSTVTTLLAFIPIIMMRDKAGDFIRSMPLTVVYTLSASLLLALTFYPYLAAKFLPDFKPEKKIKKPKGSAMQRFIDGYYTRILTKSLQHRGLVIVVAFVIFAGSAAMFPLIGVSFFPKAEKSQFMVDVVTPDGSSLAYTDSIAIQTEQIIDSIPEVQFFATNVGHGNPKIYYNIFPKSFAKNYAQIFVQLEEYREPFFSDLMDSVRNKLSNRAEAQYRVREFDQGPPIEAPIVVRVIGKNLKTLKGLAAKVEQMLYGIEGAFNIDNQMAGERTDISFSINRTKAASYGVPLHEIDRTIRAAFAGVDVSRYRDEEGKEYDIVIRMPFKIRPSLSDFDKVFVKSMSGRFIPLKQVTDIRFSAAPTEISHFKAERTASVTCDVAKGYTVDEIQKQMQQQMSQLDMPDGYSYIFGGELESREETFGGMAEAAIIAIIAIFAVLVLQFRSFGQPLIIFVSIPLAIIGSIWALYITGWTFSFTALIGMTSLIGIVINDSIILVDYSNVLMRDEKKNTVEAVIEAGQTRFMPILLTSLTTIGGLLPLTLRGGALWAPMGWTIIGGLLFSTVLTLIVVPVLYSIFTTKNQNSALKQDPIEI